MNKVAYSLKEDKGRYHKIIISKTAINLNSRICLPQKILTFTVRPIALVATVAVTSLDSTLDPTESVLITPDLRALDVVLADTLAAAVTTLSPGFSNL